MFLRDYLQILVPLLLLFGAYNTIAVPLLEPAKKEQMKSAWETPIQTKRTEWWEELFAPGDWQRSSPRVVKTETAILLFQTREQKSKTRWLFKPLTILIPQGNAETSKQAIVIKNANGAEIEFKSEVEWNKELPPVETGQLMGNISIYSPPNEAEKKDGMLIETRDVRINKREIWTDQAINMKLGNAIIEGRMLAIHLDKDLLTSDDSQNQPDSPFNGLDFLELVYVDRVAFKLENGGLWPSNEIPDIKLRPAHATIKCQGSFIFQFHHSQAILQNGVHMEHIVQGLVPDTFDCNELRLNIGLEKKRAAPAAGSLAASTSNWKLERLEAFGASGRDSKDRSRWLKLVAPGMQAEAHGQHLVMDLVNGMVTLNNRLPSVPARESFPVYLRRESAQIWAPEIQYLNPDALLAMGDANPGSNNPATIGNPTEKTKRLGAILAEGAGSAQLDSRGESWKLFWGERLSVRPDGEMDLITIKGSANVSNPTQGRFMAENLNLWVTPTSAERMASLASQFPSGKVPQFLPDRMHAIGEVEVNSPELRANVTEMQVWFSYPIQSPANINNAGLASSLPKQPSELLGLGPATGIAPSPLMQPSNPQQPKELNAQSLQAQTPPSQNEPGANRASKSSGPTNKQVSPYNITANSMQASVVRKSQETLIDDLNLDGNFTLTRDVLSEESPWPFTATGDRLQLKQSTSEVTDITIVGRPGMDAKVAVGSGWVVAPELKLLQSQNEFWINHPGTLVIPNEVLERVDKDSRSQSPNASMVSGTGLPKPPNLIGGFVPAIGSRSTNNQTGGAKVIWRSPPRIEWGQRMTFDGRIARFGGGVTVDGKMETDPQTLWHISAKADGMAVEMVEPVFMQGEGASKSNPHPEIATIRMEGNVDLRTAQTDQKGIRRSLEHMRLPQLDFMVPTQTWLGHGPGELWSRRMGSNPIQLGTPQSSGLPKQQDPNEDNTLQCIHLTFMGSMQGSIPQRTTTFYDRIDTLIGPIRDWDEEINVHLVERLAKNQSKLFADQLSLFDASGLSWNQNTVGNSFASKASAWEIVAQSRVSMLANTDRGELTISADRLGYSAAKDMISIDRSPREVAIIRQLLNDGSSPVELHVSTAKLKLKTNELDMQLTKIEGGIPVSMQPKGGAPNGPLNGPAPGKPAGSGGANQIPSPRDFNPMQPNPNSNRSRGKP